MPDLTTEFVAYRVGLKAANPGALDVTTLITKDIPAVVAATDERDDRNTQYAEYFSRLLLQEPFDYADTTALLAAGWKERNAENHTLSLADGVLTIETVVGTASGIYMNLPVTAGQALTVTCRASRISGSGTATLRLGDGADEFEMTTWDAVTTSATPELLTATMTPSNEVITIYLRKNGTQRFTFSSLVVTQVPA